MRQKEGPARQTQGTDQNTNANSTLPRPEISNLHGGGFGRARWQFTLTLGPVEIDCNLVTDADGKPSFVASARIKDSYSQQYRATAKLDCGFSKELLEAVVARLNADSFQSEDGPFYDLDREL